MIKRLRLKFIVINMGIATILLSACLLYTSRCV